MQHLHVDKVAYKLLRRERSNIDRSMLLLGVVGPLASIPQIITIYSTQDAGSVSAYSWGIYIIVAFVSLAYAAIHRLRPVFISSSLSVFTCMAIFVGCLIY